MARGDEPQGEAMLGGERLFPDVGGKKETSGLVQGKAASVSRGGAKQEAARAAGEFWQIRQKSSDFLLTLRKSRLSWQTWIRREYARLLIARLSTFISAVRRECGDVAFAASSLLFHS